jgi:catechol 2,3-dioxygenase-like lactoylglutathione lyase family enzyme
MAGWHLFPHNSPASISNESRDSWRSRPTFARSPLRRFNPTTRRCYVRPVLDSASFVGFIPVRDTAAARSFYEGILGLRVVEDTPFAMVVDAGGTMLRLTPVPEFNVQPFTIAGWHVPDLTATANALADLGVHLLRYDGLEQSELGVWTAPSGDQVAWFNDPDGNTLSLTAFAR